MPIWRHRAKAVGIPGDIIVCLTSVALPKPADRMPADWMPADWMPADLTNDD